MGKFLTFFLQMTFSILINSKKQQHCNFHLIYIRNRLTWGGLALSNTNYFHPEMHFWGSLSKLAPLPFVSLTDFWFSLRVRGFDYLSSHAIHLDVLASSANAAFEISEYLLLATRTQTHDRRLVCDSSVSPPVGPPLCACDAMAPSAREALTSAVGQQQTLLVLCAELTREETSVPKPKALIHHRNVLFIPKE